jgi:predicted helicase
MYARFFRWASDRLDENGILAFTSNRSFIESRTFDGFRKVVENEFNAIYIVDLGGDVRSNPKLSGTKHNVFGIQTGVAISFMVKRQKVKDCRIFYTRRPELETAEEKLAFLGGIKFERLAFDEIRPDAKNNWLNLTDNDFDSLLPIGTKTAKSAKSPSQAKAIFKLFSLGVVTARDEWVYDDDPQALKRKVAHLIDVYNADSEKLSAVRNSNKLADMLDYSIKWTRAVKNDLSRGIRYEFDNNAIIPSLYRPHVKRWEYFSKKLNEMTYQLERLFPQGVTGNKYITFVSGNRLDFAALAGNALPNYAIYSLDPAQCLPLCRYDESGQCIDNITDWAYDQFRKKYQPGRAKAKRPTDKEAIFHYVYGVLHDPVYREKYAQNLKREFPRIPLYADFWQWADWGKALMALHIGYETVAPAALKRTDIADEKVRKSGQAPKALLKADRDGGRIVLDSETTLSGIPPAAWDYRLGNRSALEWILDQYKESKPKDPTIREKFDTYRFADYKEQVIDLLLRVTTVSVQTVAITAAMKKAAR